MEKGLRKRAGVGAQRVENPEKRHQGGHTTLEQERGSGNEGQVLQSSNCINDRQRRLILKSVLFQTPKKTGRAWQPFKGLREGKERNFTTD